jgi:hypothetical protein
MGPSILFYGVPLTACISLVYCASRYELSERIVRSATVMFLKTLVGMTGIYAVLWFVSR